MKQNMQDLTEGPLGKKILIFSVPLMLSNLLQVLFNMADIAVIGQFAGSLSLGAVGSTATLVTMFTGFLIGLSGGINVLTALYYGAKDRESLSKTIHSAALVSLIMGVLLLVLGVGLSEWMLTMLKTREELLDKAVLYLRIYYLGMPALAIYNFGNAVYSAVGNTKKPLYYLGFSGVLNYSEPVFCDRLSYGCGRSGIGQYHFPVCICSINPAGTASLQRHLCPASGKAAVGSGTYEGYPEAGNALRIAECNFPVCQQLCADGCEFL